MDLGNHQKFRMIQNSSNVDPGGVGNTEPHQKKKSGQNSPKAIWIITLKAEKWNSSNSSNMSAWLRHHTRDATWQVEVGEGGYKHVQLTMRLKFKNRLSWLKRHFSKLAHCEVVNNVDGAFDYSVKNDTRLYGPFFWPEPLCDTIDDPLEGLTLYDWQQEIVDVFEGPVDSRKIYWYWEPNGCVGKSDFCLHAILKYGAVVYDSGKKDILFAHKDHTKVIFDLSRTQEGYVSYDAMETLKKGFCFSGKYESGMKVYPKPHLVVFANWEPDKAKLSADRWVVRKIG